MWQGKETLLKGACRVKKLISGVWAGKLIWGVSALPLIQNCLNATIQRVLILVPGHQGGRGGGRGEGRGRGIGEGRRKGGGGCCKSHSHRGVEAGKDWEGYGGGRATGGGGFCEYSKAARPLREVQPRVA